MGCGLSYDAQILWKKPEKEWLDRVAELFPLSPEPDATRKFQIAMCREHGYVKTLKYLTGAE